MTVARVASCCQAPTPPLASLIMGVKVPRACGMLWICFATCSFGSIPTAHHTAGALKDERKWCGASSRVEFRSMSLRGGGGADGGRETNGAEAEAGAVTGKVDDVLLESKGEHFGEMPFWDDFHSSQSSSSFEWYGTWEDISSIVTGGHLPPSVSVFPRSAPSSP